MNRLDVAEALLKSCPDEHLCFIGFDGFTDEIVRAVDLRVDPYTFTPIETIGDFADRIFKASGKSCNIELVCEQKRIGGNGPIMAQALLEGGHRIILAGAVGQGTVEPLFTPLAERCEQVAALCPSGHTDAVEFNDGKVLLGKMNTLPEICYETLTEQIAEERLFAILEACTLFVSANWTMLPHMNSLWKALLKRVICRCQEKRRTMWVDLADTTKRPIGDLKEALQLLPLFQPKFHVMLGLNHAELQQVYYALTGKSEERALEMAEQVYRELGLHGIIIHAPQFAIAVSEEKAVQIEAPYCPNPKTVTGGGDHFNAGYCNALLFGLPIEGCLIAAVATSGFYVRYAKSPSMAELAHFLQRWHLGLL